jgi:hypothetical protein
MLNQRKSIKSKLTSLLGATMISTTAGILPIPLPDTLKGEWVVLTGDCLYDIGLLTDEMPEANGLKLKTNTPKENCKLLINAVAWRPYPDGISLLDKEGSTIVFFSRDKEIYRSEISGNSGFTLKRKF